MHPTDGIAAMSTLCLCDLSDNDLRVLASLSARPQPATAPTPSLRLPAPAAWMRSPSPVASQPGAQAALRS